jgi:hypothetical protein
LLVSVLFNFQLIAIKKHIALVTTKTVSIQLFLKKSRGEGALNFCNSDDWQGYDDYQFYLLNYTNRPTLHERRLKIDGK